MNAWNTIVTVACSALLLFLCRKETLRRNKARLVWRLLASAIAVVCLACMAIPLAITAKKKTGTTLIVTTEGASQDSINRFRKEQKRELPVWEKERFLSDPDHHYDSVHVFGYGFSGNELALLPDATLIFHPSVIANGITDVDWNRQVTKGEQLQVQGSYVNTGSSPVAVLLTGFATVLDSFMIPAKKTQSFYLHDIPKQKGRAIYTLLALQGKDTLERNPVPFEVVEQPPVKIMILAASPDFENKFLKDWLSQEGYSVVTKTNISTNKFDRSAFNTGKVSLDHFTPAILDSFDLMISDESALASLGEQDRENIHRQITGKGMGLIVRGDTVLSPAAWYTRPFHLYRLSGTQPSHLAIHTGENRKALLPVEQPVFIHLQNGMQPLVTDSAGVVAANTIEGSGKILFTTLQNTYSWLLAGNMADYYGVWSLLLQKAGRPYPAPVSFGMAPALPIAQEPVRVWTETTGDTLPSLLIGNSRLALVQYLPVPSGQQGIYWPLQTGWQPPVTVMNGLYNWYVYGRNDWRHVSARRNIQATAAYLRQKKNKPEGGAVAPNGPPEPLSLFSFFLLFILSCTFLWAERKIS